MTPRHLRHRPNARLSSLLDHPSTIAPTNRHRTRFECFSPPRRFPFTAAPSKIHPRCHPGHLHPVRGESKTHTAVRGGGAVATRPRAHTTEQSSTRRPHLIVVRGSRRRAAVDTAVLARTAVLVPQKTVAAQPCPYRQSYTLKNPVASHSPTSERNHGRGWEAARTRPVSSRSTPWRLNGVVARGLRARDRLPPTPAPRGRGE